MIPRSHSVVAAASSVLAVGHSSLQSDRDCAWKYIQVHCLGGILRDIKNWLILIMQFSLVSLFPVVIAGDGVLKVGVFQSCIKDIYRWTLCIIWLTCALLCLDLWLRCLKVPLPYDTHVSGWHLSLDGSRSYPESSSVRNLWHLFIWCGK